MASAAKSTDCSGGLVIMRSGPCENRRVGNHGDGAGVTVGDGGR